MPTTFFAHTVFLTVKNKLCQKFGNERSNQLDIKKNISYTQLASLILHLSLWVLKHCFEATVLVWAAVYPRSEAGGGVALSWLAAQSQCLECDGRAW